MNKTKKVWITIGSTLLGLYILFLISPLVLSPVIDSYSDEIEDTLKNTTGFNVDFDDISLKTSWNLSIGLKAKNIEFAIPSSDAPFFKAQNAGAEIKLLPLLLKKVQLNGIFAQTLDSELVVKKDGSLQILDYIPQNEDQTTTKMNGLPFGLKLSNNLPNVKIKNYKVTFADAISDKTYYAEGSDLHITDFILDKNIKLKTKGKIVFDNTVISNYDIKIANKIMPKLQLDDLIFPKDIVIDNDKTEEILQTKTTPVMLNLIETFDSINKNNFSADLTTDVKTSGTIKNPQVKGSLNIDALSVAVNNQKLPESYIHLDFKGHKTDIDSSFFSSNDQNENTQIIGNIKNGKKPSIDLTLRSNAKFNNLIRLCDSIAQAFGNDDLKTLKATGGIDADFNINSDLKKVTSTGYLKVLPSTLSYGLYNVIINDITADIDMMNNNINIKKAGFSIKGHPLKLVGTIENDSTTDLKLTADKLSLKGVLAAFGQVTLLKQNDINDGLVSLNAKCQGKLKSIKPEIVSNIERVNVFNKDSKINLTLANALVKILYNGKTATGNVDVTSLALKHQSATVSVPKTNILIDEKNINIQNSYIMLNNSRIDVQGSIKEYLTDRLTANINANGKLNSADIVALLPKEFKQFVGYKGQIPLNVNISGSSKVQNIKLLINANPNNYVSLADIDLLKNQNTKIHSNIEIIGDSLTLSDTGISNDKTTIANITGGISKLYSTPKMNINIAIPNEISFPIWGVKNSNITANGSVTAVGELTNPNLRGTVNIVDLSMKDLDFAISDLVADLSGAILNGSATARQFKSGNIIATDLAGNFSLKNYSKFYLTELTGKAFDGNISGNLSYDINSEKTGIELNGSGLNSTKAIYGAIGIKNALTGVLNFSSKLGMQGISDRDIINSLKGNINFDINDGRFMSIGRLENLVTAQNISSNSILKSAVSALSTFSTIQDSDRFKSIKGELVLDNGNANLTKILVAGPLMSYYVHGTYYILPNSANLIILGRLDTKVVSCLGPLGELSAEKLLSYIPKFGAMTANILKQITSDPTNENTAMIPDLTTESKAFKDFKVIFNGPVESSSSVRNFKWLSTCDTTKMNVKKDLENAKDAVKTNINNRVENAKNTAQNVKTNVNHIVETQKNKVEEAKKDFAQTKADIEKAKENREQSAENLKNLFKNAIKNSQNKVEPSQTSNETTTKSE